MKIKMIQTVTPGLPFYGKSGTILYNGSTYPTVIENDITYGVCGNGELLRVNPEDYILLGGNHEQSK